MPTADIKPMFNPLSISSSVEVMFITNVLNLLKDEKHFPYIGTQNISAAIELISEISASPLPESCNSVLIWDELCMLVR